jgi:hypothetical protein
MKKPDVRVAFRRGVKKRTKTNEGNTSIADEASDWLASQSLVAA